MTPADAFRAQPVLLGPRVRLEPLTEAVLDDYLLGLDDPEVRRLTGTHSQFTRSQVQRWLGPGTSSTTEPTGR